jgi:hypothetical protein
MHFIGAVMRCGLPHHKGNEDIREEMAITDIHIIIVKVSTEIARTFGRKA